MDRFILREPVEITGRDYRGFKSSLRLEPTEQPGWYWNVDGKDIAITAALLKHGRRRVMLAHGGHCLNVFEHLGVLRFFGLDNVRIISESSWLPYDGSAGIFWNACRPYMKHAGTLNPYTIRKEIEIVHNGWRKVALQPAASGSLNVQVHINYRGLGERDIEYSIHPMHAGPLLFTKSQGWPPWLHAVARAAPAFIWPHYNSIVWPQNGRGYALRAFALHRILDVLGALSVLCPPRGVLVGKVSSICGGHGQDVELVQKAAQLIAPYKLAH